MQATRKKRALSECKSLRRDTLIIEEAVVKSKKAKQAEEAKIRADDRERKKQERSRQEKKNYNRAVSEGIEPVGHVQLNDDAASTSRASPNVAVITRTVAARPLALFFKMMPPEIWNSMIGETNKELDRKFRAGSVGQDHWKRYCGGVSALDLHKLFTIRLGRSLGRKPPLLLNCKRERAIATSLRWSWDVVLPIFRLTWQGSINPSEDVSVDEALFQYNPQGKQKKHCPKRYVLLRSCTAVAEQLTFASGSFLGSPTQTDYCATSL
jgi:hypothetical protein